MRVRSPPLAPFTLVHQVSHSVGEAPSHPVLRDFPPVVYCFSVRLTYILTSKIIGGGVK